jgi:hypothetical protein
MGNLIGRKSPRAVRWLTRQSSSDSASVDDVIAAFEDLGYEFDEDYHLGHVGGTRLSKCRYFRLVDGPSRVNRQRLASDEMTVRQRLKLADSDASLLCRYVSGYWVVYVDEPVKDIRHYFRLCAGPVWPPKITV